MTGQTRQISYAVKTTTTITIKPTCHPRAKITTLAQMAHLL
jgi:hypothetical protein